MKSDTQLEIYVIDISNSQLMAQWSERHLQNFVVLNVTGSSLAQTIHFLFVSIFHFILLIYQFTPLFHLLVIRTHHLPMGTGSLR